MGSSEISHFNPTSWQQLGRDQDLVKMAKVANRSNISNIIKNIFYQMSGQDEKVINKTTAKNCLRERISANSFSGDVSAEDKIVHRNVIRNAKKVAKTYIKILGADQNTKTAANDFIRKTQMNNVSFVVEESELSEHITEILTSLLHNPEAAANALKNIKGSKDDEIVEELFKQSTKGDMESIKNIAVQLARTEVQGITEGTKPLRESTLATKMLRTMSNKLIGQHLLNGINSTYNDIPSGKFTQNDLQDVKDLVTSILQTTEDMLNMKSPEIALFKQMSMEIKLIIEEKKGQDGFSDLNPDIIGADQLFLRVLNPAITDPSALGKGGTAMDPDKMRNAGLLAGIIQKLMVRENYDESAANAMFNPVLNNKELKEKMDQIMVNVYPMLE